MLKKFNKRDIDIIMKIWKDNNQQFQPFIKNQYWIDNYVKTRDEFLASSIYVYTEAEKILAFISVSNQGEILSIQVKPEIIREGIGKLLLEKVKTEYDTINIKIYKKNVNGVLFFKAMGFKKVNESIDENTNEIIYNLQYNKGNVINSYFIYFDNSISDKIIEKYDKINNVQIFNIHTFSKEANNVFNIDISNSLTTKNENIYIKDYMDVRNKLKGIIKDKNTTIFFDCNNEYNYLFEVIKDIAKVKGKELTIIMHKPFSVEGTKKNKLYEEVKNNFKEFNVIDVDYEEIWKNKNITFKDAFDFRDEAMLQMLYKSK